MPSPAPSFLSAVENPAPSVTLYQAPWVVPVSSPVIRDGAVAVAGGRILAVDNAASLLAQYGCARIECCSGVLLPGLVNGHIHLELSAFTGIPRPSSGESFCDWIRALLQVRQEGRISPDEQAAAAREMLQQQYDSGVLLLLDIGNNQPAKQSPSCPSPSSWPQVVFLRELLAPTAQAEEQLLTQIALLADDVAATPHALYSTTVGVISALKRRAERLGHPLSLHVAESADEIELLRSGQGCFRNFLAERGAWEDAFPPLGTGRGIDTIGAVEYLDGLGLLDPGLLCVHCVQVSESEVRMLAARGCKVCLCPGSNRFLGVGVAPLEMMLRHNLLPALGTDSRASNDEIDLWREMQILREDHPQVNPALILAMATLGGAQALGWEQDCGALAPGRTATFLHVDSSALQAVESAEELVAILTGNGRPTMIRWVTEA